MSIINLHSFIVFNTYVSLGNILSDLVCSEHHVIGIVLLVHICDLLLSPSIMFMRFVLLMCIVMVHSFFHGCVDSIPQIRHVLFTEATDDDLFLGFAIMNKAPMNIFAHSFWNMCKTGIG